MVEPACVSASSPMEDNAMVTARFTGNLGELCVKLKGMTSTQCQQIYLQLGSFLADFSDSRLANIGKAILRAVKGKGKDVDPLTGPDMPSCPG